MLPMNELATFVSVVEAGSLSAAARSLGTSKTTISDQVRRLEERLGSRLLNRTTRRIALTEAGRACYSHATRMVDAAQAAATAASLFHQQPRGALRITAPTTFAPLHVVPMLPDFLARNPQLTVDLSLSAATVDIIEAGIDLAIRIGVLVDSRLVARRLAVSRLIVCAAPAYLQRTGTPVTPDDLTGHAALGFVPLGWRGIWRLVGPDGRERRLPMPALLDSDDGDVLLSAAEAGLGLVAIPNWMAAGALRDGRLVQVLPGWGGRPVPIHAVHASGGQTPAKIRQFVDHLAAHLTRADWRV